MTADVYTLAGERVAHLARAADGALHWPLGTQGPASGLYLALLRAQDAQGQWVRTTLKLAILR